MRQWPDNWDPCLGFALVNALPSDRLAGARIPGSMTVPRGGEHLVFHRFDQDKEIIVYGESSACEAAPQLARDLISKGFSSVTIYRAGVEGWQAAGGPIVIFGPRPGSRRTS